MKQSSWSIISRVMREHVAVYARRILIAVCFMVVAGCMTGLFAKLIQPVLDHVLTNNNQRHVLPVALGVMACFVLRGVATYTSAVLMIRVGQGIVADIQTRLFGKLVSFDLSYFHDTASGALQSRVTNDVNILRIAVVDTLMGLGKSSITLIVLVAVMLMQDWLLTVISFVLLPLIVGTTMTIGKKLRKVSRKTQDQQAELAAQLTQVFQGIRQVKSFVAEDVETERAKRAFENLRNLNVKSTELSNLTLPINDVVMGTTIVGLVLYGAWAIAEGRLTPGELLSFIAAFVLAYEPLKQLAKLNATLDVGIGASERIFATIDAQPAIVTPNNPLPLPIPPYEITFENVVFQYPNVDAPILDGLNLTIKAGERVALVGSSGGGKTTIMNLIPRFYDPIAGRVLVNGVDIKDLDLTAWRLHVALVSQDIMLFSDTVTGNIAYGQRDITPESVEAAARAANAHDFIMGLPQGYDTQLGENGVRLSGGQRQRIALARAILKNAPVLLLDEATSALDTESEMLIQKALESFSVGRTVVTIAHRLSTIQNADRILVVRDGQVIEEGTHEVLLALGREYARLNQGSAL